MNRLRLLALVSGVLWVSLAATASAYRAPTPAESFGIEHALESADVRRVSEIHVADQGGWATAIVAEAGENEKPLTLKVILREYNPGEWDSEKEAEIGSLGYCISPGSELSRIEMPNVIAQDLGFRRCTPVREARTFVMYQPFFDDAVAYRPQNLILEGKGHFRMKDVHWTEWGAESARGTATAWRRACKRTACSRVQTTTARLVLSRPVQCQEKHQYASEGPHVFSRLHWQLARALPGGIAREGSISMLSGPATTEPCRAVPTPPS